MGRKKLEVVELNKKEEKILLEETQSPFILFLRRHRLLILLTLLILSLAVLFLGAYLVIKNLDSSEEPNIKLVDIETNLKEENVIEINSNLSTDDSSAKEKFDKGVGKNNGEILTVKTVETGKFILKFYSDGTALKIMKSGNNATRIFPLDDGNYGIKENGNIDINAKTIETKIKEKKEYPWGTVTYLLDGSADITGNKNNNSNNEIINMFVRNSNDISENYISNNKVSYPKKIENIGSSIVTYYYDGTIEIKQNEISHLVRNADDIKINGNNITYPNNNDAVIIETKKMSDGREINYYSDGGAIIKDGSRTISVRKSNSIVIEDNKIYEIVDNIYVTESKKNNAVINYTNGGAVVDFNGETYYVNESSNIKYNSDGSIKEITNEKEKFIKENNTGNSIVKDFEKTSIVTTNDYIAIVPKENVILDTNGKLKEIIEVNNFNNDDSTFVVKNNTNEKIKYRVILDKSDRTNLDTKYIKYQIKAKDEYINPTFLNDAYWNEDALLKEVNLAGDNYILIENSLEPFETVGIKLMLWTDYETIPNTMQNKYFYGTIRVFAWTEE